MEPTAPAEAPGVDRIPLSPSLELRVTPVADCHAAGITAVDLRLWRRMGQGGPVDPECGWAVTSAGFRVSLRALPELVTALQAKLRG